MSRKRLCLKVLSIAAIAIGGVFLLLTILSGVLLRSADDGCMRLGSSRFAAVEIASPDYPRGSMIGLTSGSIPENTPVAVSKEGIAVLTAEQLEGETGISREQVLGGVRWCVPMLGWLAIWIQTVPGLLLCLLLPAALIGCGVAELLWCGGAKGGRSPLPAKNTAESEPETEEEPFAALDYRLKSKEPSVPPAVKTVVITQTRPASSAIRNQKGEVRIYAAGQEKVLPLNTGRRVVTLGGYTITVDIARSDGQQTEDITRELPVLRREPRPEPDLDDTQQIEIVNEE